MICRIELKMEVWSCDRIKIWKIKSTTNKGVENEKRKTEKEEEKKSSEDLSPRQKLNIQGRPKDVKIRSQKAIKMPTDKKKKKMDNAAYRR